MNAQFQDQGDGERRKADALALLADRRAVYVRRGQRALLTAVLATGTATADDVRDSLKLPPGIDPVCLGAVPTALVRGRIDLPGRLRPNSPANGSRAAADPSGDWRTATRPPRWLADHPNLPDPAERRPGRRRATCSLSDPPHKRTGRDGCRRCARAGSFETCPVSLHPQAAAGNGGSGGPHPLWPPSRCLSGNIATCRWRGFPRRICIGR